MTDALTESFVRRRAERRRAALRRDLGCTGHELGPARRAKPHGASVSGRVQIEHMFAMCSCVETAANVLAGTWETSPC